MNAQCGCSAVPTEGCRVARPEGERAASRAKRVIVINAAEGLNPPCWASRSSRGCPLLAAERGTRRARVTCIKPFETAVAICTSGKGGSGVTLTGSG